MKFLRDVCLMDYNGFGPGHFGIAFCEEIDEMP